jgi:hypothetical protein
VSRGTLDPAYVTPAFVYGIFTLSDRLSQNRSTSSYDTSRQSVTPACTHAGLGSFQFARRYFGNRCFFLFLRVLRCFSSPGSLPYVMYWRMDTCRLGMWVSPFRYLRIKGYLLLPEAFRSLSRLSSALSAKASTLRSSLFDLPAPIAFGTAGTCDACASSVSFSLRLQCLIRYLLKDNASDVFSYLTFDHQHS